MGFRQCSPYQAVTSKICRLKQHFVPPATAWSGLKIPFLYSHKVLTWFCYFCLFLFSNRLHYRVFYSLYLYENAFEATCASINSVFDQNFTGQQSIMRYRYAKLYCAFHKLANAKVQKPPSQLHFLLPSIIITITSNEPWNTETHKTDRNPPITDHKPWPFEPVKVKFCFLRGWLRWLTAAKNAIVNWLLNFRIRMFVKSTVIVMSMRRRWLLAGLTEIMDKPTLIMYNQ